MKSYIVGINLRMCMHTYVANLRHDQLVQLVRNLHVAQPNVNLVLAVRAAEHGGGTGGRGQANR